VHRVAHARDGAVVDRLTSGSDQVARLLCLKIRQRSDQHSGVILDRAEVMAEPELFARLSVAVGDVSVKARPSGSFSLEHSRGLHVNHQKRDDLLKGRVGDASARVLER
jgi:hypothetical protein